MRIILLYLGIFLLMASCKTAAIIVADDLKTSTDIYNVKDEGLLKKKVSFGSYIAKETKISVRSETQTEFFYNTRTKQKRNIKFDLSLLEQKIANITTFHNFEAKYRVN